MRTLPALCTLPLLCSLAVAQSPTPASTPIPVTVIFQQPVLDKIAGNFHVPPVEHKFPDDHTFNLVLWQPNPFIRDGFLVPSSISSEDKTGLKLSDPIHQQLAFRDAPGSSLVQVDGDAVGVYINSADLSKGSPGSKMMITPEFMAKPADRIRPYAKPGMAIVTTFDLQIPISHADNSHASQADNKHSLTYIVTDFVFEDRTTHTKITYEFTCFHLGMFHGNPPPVAWLRKYEAGAYDAPSQTFQVNNPISPDSRLHTVLPGSTLFQSAPWTGWRPFRVAITQQNFATSLQALLADNKGFKGSANPADYTLISAHLNAELKYDAGPSDLGWSLRRERISLVPAARLTDLTF